MQKLPLIFNIKKEKAIPPTAEARWFPCRKGSWKKKESYP